MLLRLHQFALHHDPALYRVHFLQVWAPSICVRVSPYLHPSSDFQLLRKEGYYTTNNVKTDYNSGNYQQIIEKSWNESSSTAHWRKRSEEKMPFFSVFNLMTSHQSRSMVWSHEKFKNEIQSKLREDQIHHPHKIKIPPYYPDTPIVRKTVARFHDCVTAMDREVGEILEQLKEDGLAENTIVFFFSDHGSGMPRHKRALLDSGMHVPLLVRFPKKMAASCPIAAWGKKSGISILCGFWTHSS